MDIDNSIAVRTRLGPEDGINHQQFAEAEILLPIIPTKDTGKEKAERKQ